MKKISIVIPTQLKRLVTLHELLHSIYDQGFAPSKFEVIVVYNDSSNKIPQFKSSIFKKIIFKKINIANRNKARNLGLKIAQAPIVYFLDDDCYLNNKQHLQNLYKLHQQKPNMIIGGGYLSENSLIQKYNNMIVDLWIKKSILRNQPLVPAGNLSIKKKLLNDETFFDTQLMKGGEEFALYSKYENRKGLFLFSSKLNVTHKHQSSIFNLLKKAFDHGKVPAPKPGRTPKSFYISLLKKYSLDQILFLICYTSFLKIGAWAKAK